VIDQRLMRQAENAFKQRQPSLGGHSDKTAYVKQGLDQNRREALNPAF